MFMRKYKRIFTIVIDSLGIGEMKDSATYGDAGANTLRHIAEHRKGFCIPNLRRLGIANLCELPGVEPEEKPLGKYAKLNEKKRVLRKRIEKCLLDIDILQNRGDNGISIASRYQRRKW